MGVPMRNTVKVVRVDVIKLSLRASITTGSCRDRRVAPIGLLRKSEATGRAMKPTARISKKASPVFKARSLALAKMPIAS
jgi:hypothetical protein